jgi:uncharacterized protein (TIGR02001 family)
MKKFLLAAVALGAVVAGSAQAEGALSYNVALTSDYVFRGISQNDANPALQGGIDYSNGIFYAGAWASNVSFADREIDGYLGVKPTLGKFAFDFGAVYYNYNADSLNSSELKAAVSYPIEKLTVGAAVYHSVDFDDTNYYEVNAAYPLADKITVSAALGEQKTTDDAANFTTGNVGVTYAITPTWSVDARYSDTNLDDKLNKAAAARFAVTLKAAF